MEARPGGLSSEERKEILVTAFSDTPDWQLSICRRDGCAAAAKDRPLYSLLYCTRNKTGIEVFRKCQIAALKEQSRTRAAVKIRHAKNTTSQGEIFSVPTRNGAGRPAYIPALGA
jgi:hypothetical protein